MTVPVRRDYAAELRELMARPAAAGEFADRISRWDASVPDGLNLAYAYQAAGAHTWSPLDDVIAGTEPRYARRARLWAEVAERHDVLQERNQRATATAPGVPEYLAALEAIPDDDSRAHALTAGVEQQPDYRTAAEAVVVEHNSAIARIRAVKERIDAARVQLDHAEVEVRAPEHPGGVDERLATVRALLRDGDRMLQEAAREPGEDEDLDSISETAVDSESETSRERTVWQTQPRI